MRKVALLGLALACGPAVGPAVHPNDPKPEPPAITVPEATDVKLPRGVTPAAYRLDLVVDPTKETFSGKVSIDVTLDAPAEYIVMHGRDIHVTSASAVAGDKNFSAKTRTRRAKGGRAADEELVLIFGEKLPAGKIRVDIAYSAPFAQGLRGLYRMSVANAWYAFTQLEAVDARRMFPSFDEPRFKTPFTLSITTPKTMRAFANAPETKKEAAGDQIKYEFAATPPIPTYLVAIAVGDIDVEEGVKKPFPIRLLASAGKAKLGKTSLSAANDFLAILGAYFDVPYAYGKLDVAAVPDFGPGAMENAGLVTFREELLLVDGDNSSLPLKRRMAGVMSHELAHQWFGDLVTMPWWDDIWLNEGFATWMAAKACDQWQRGFGAKNELLLGKLGAMNADMLPSSRPVRIPIDTSDAILESGGWSAYQKGGSVLAMLERWLGEQPFRDGLRAYIKSHANGLVTSDDLLESLGKATGKDVAKVAKSFLDQPGLPVVDAKVSCEGGKGRIHLRQSELALPGASASRKWTIPVCIDAGKSGSKCALLDRGDGDIELASCPAWVYPNDGESGYYRFTLDAAAQKALAASAKNLSEQERIGFLSNAWALVQAGGLDVGSLFAMLDAMSIGTETSRFVVDEAIAVLQGARDAFVDDARAPKFAAIVSRLLAAQAKRLGWDAKHGEPDDARLMRISVLSALSDLAEDPALTPEAEKRAAAYLKNPTSIYRDLAPLALRISARTGGAATFDALRSKLATALPYDRILLVSALGAFKDEATLRKAYDLALSNEIHAGDFRYLYVTASRYIETRKIFSAWVRESWSKVKTALGAVGGLAATIGWACDRASLDAALRFYDGQVGVVEGMQRPYDEGVAQSKLCIQMRTREDGSWAK
jgi:alanyl aminopeptidase